MMKKNNYQIYAILAILCLGYFAQDLAAQCDYRYRQAVFDDVTVETVTYSDVTGYQMDIYHPTGDVSDEPRPVIVLAHGGSFIGGTRTNSTMVQMCTDFARRGYVAASYTYTLASNPALLIDSTEMMSVVVNAVADGRAAVRYFRQDADTDNTYNIDPNRIIAGGNSAGAILSLHLAYIDDLSELPDYLADAVEANGGIEGEAGNPGYSSEVTGVINLAGGVNNLDMIDADEPPTVSCHGDQDGVVPFDCNDVFWGDPVFGALDLADLCGSSVIHPTLEAAGVTSDFLVFDG
ncbi:MAG: alpha/beta hydrolase, partial [Chitinophagales bacterium]